MVDVGTEEVTILQVPSNVPQRRIKEMTLSERSGASNTLTLTVVYNTTTVKTFTITLDANEVLQLKDFLTLYAGWKLNGVAGTASIHVEVEWE